MGSLAFSLYVRESFAVNQIIQSKQISLPFPIFIQYFDPEKASTLSGQLIFASYLEPALDRRSRRFSHSDGHTQHRWSRV
jgi:hypothetical protein